MPEDNPAQPLLDMRSKLGEWSRKILSYDKPVDHKEDTSWHDQMLKQANESFAKKAEEDRKSSAKKTPQKRMPRKR